MYSVFIIVPHLFIGAINLGVLQICLFFYFDLYGWVGGLADRQAGRSAVGRAVG